MLKIRLKRVGRRNRPSFRIMVVDSRQGPKSGRFVEQVGFYNPITKDKDIKNDRVKYWIEHGAQASDTVYNMLVAAGVIEGKKKNVLPKKSPIENTKAANADGTGEQPDEEVKAEETTAPADDAEEASAEDAEEKTKEPSEDEEEKAAE